MKIQIGDMLFEDEARRSAGSRTAEDWAHDQNRAEQVLRQNMNLFLQTAEKCYIERYRSAPERTTLNEF